MNLTYDTELDKDAIYSSHLGAFIICNKNPSNSKTANGNPIKSYSIMFINEDNLDSTCHIFNKDYGYHRKTNSYTSYIIRTAGNMGTLTIVFEK